jgi:hypothetical protein
MKAKLAWFFSLNILIALSVRADTNEVAPGVLQIGAIQNAAVTESSGIIASRRGRGLYWTHNDSGADVLYGIGADGASAGQYKIKDVELQDWEDVASTPGRLYIADIGNNGGGRNEVNVYAVTEPNPRAAGELRPLKHWQLSYPEDPFDAESLVISRGYGYIIAKELSGGEARVYRFRLNAKSNVTLEKQCKLNVNAPIGGADLTADNKRLAVITHEGAYLFQLPGRIPADGKLEPALFVPFSHDRMEGCCFTRDGLLVTAETGEIYLFTDGLFRLRVPRH